MREAAISLLKELTEAHGVSGSEEAVGAIFRRELEGCGTMAGDRLGSLACERSGIGPRVLVAGHFDEVGFAVQNITPRGFLKIVALGGWWTHALVAQRLRVLTRSGREIIGVVGSVPPHFLSEGQKEKLLTVDQLCIDIGASSGEEAESWGVGLGDSVAPFSEFTPMAHPDLFIAKAFDNRCGVGAAIQSMQILSAESLPCTLIAAGSVQEEVGCRGAVTLGKLTRPDFALVMECTPADDTHGMDLADSQGRLRSGPQIRMMDPTAIMNRGLVQFVADTAKAEGIPYQIAVRKSGGTDARSIQLAEQGVPVVVVGVPSRYIHSHNSIIDINDYLNTLRLVCAVVRKADKFVP